MRLIAFKAAIALQAVLLSGCPATAPIVPEKVFIEVSRPCLTADQLPKPPALQSDAELSKLDDHSLVLTIEIQRRELRNYAAELNAVLQACIK